MMRRMCPSVSLMEMTAVGVPAMISTFNATNVNAKTPEVNTMKELKGVSILVMESLAVCLNMITVYLAKTLEVFLLFGFGLC